MRYSPCCLFLSLLSHDKFAGLLKAKKNYTPSSEWLTNRINFPTDQDHIDLRSQEMREKKITVDLDEVMNKISTAVNAAITGETNLAMISTVNRIAANRKMSVVTRGNETL